MKFLDKFKKQKKVEPIVNQTFFDYKHDWWQKTFKLFNKEFQKEIENNEEIPHERVFEFFTKRARLNKKLLIKELEDIGKIEYSETGIKVKDKEFFKGDKNKSRSKPKKKRNNTRNAEEISTSIRLHGTDSESDMA